MFLNYGSKIRSYYECIYFYVVTVVTAYKAR